MTAALAFALRHWKAILSGLVLSGLLLTLHIRTGQRNAARELAEDTQAAFDKTVADYRKAAEIARRKDVENVVRVQAEQAAITEKVSHDYQQDRVAARARADALRVSLARATDTGGRRAADLPEASTTARGPDDRATQDGFSISDRLIATEQALQLGALQTWVREQSAIDTTGVQPR